MNIRVCVTCVCVIVNEILFLCVTDGLKSFLLSILSLVKSALARAFSLIIYIGKRETFYGEEKLPLAAAAVILFRFSQLYTAISIYE